MGSDTVLTRALLGFGSGGYFLDSMVQRVGSRIALLAGHRERPAFAEVTESMAAQYMDDTRVRQLTTYLTTTRQPWFAHVHLMVTHGAQYSPREQHFSAGKAQVGDWMTDFYDDAILDADRSIAAILVLLRQRAVFDDTLIVVYSDHAQGARTDRAVPLLVRLPGGARRERVGQTVQSVDIAPTIVEALGLRVPGWMAGQSLLGHIPPCRRVFTAIAATSRLRFAEAITRCLCRPSSASGPCRWYKEPVFRVGLEGRMPTMTSSVIPLLPGASLRVSR